MRNTINSQIESSIFSKVNWGYFDGEVISTMAELMSSPYHGVS